MRKLFAKIHLWLSIPFGIIIAIVCLTGAIQVFETEIQELCHPSHYFVKEVKGEPLPPAALIESARQQLPDSIKINGIRVTPDPETYLPTGDTGQKSRRLHRPLHRRSHRHQRRTGVSSCR